MVPCGRRGTETTLSSPLGFSIHPLPAALALPEKGGSLLLGPPERGELCFKGSLPPPHGMPGSHSWGGDKDGLKRVPNQSCCSLT